MRFYLRLRTETPHKSDNTCQIQLYYVNKGLAPLRLDTTIRVLPENFKDDQVTSNDPDNVSKNIILSHCRLTAQSIITQFFSANGRNPNLNEFRAIYEYRIKQGDNKTSLFDLFEFWIKEVNKNKDKRLFYTILNSLKDYFPSTLTLGDLSKDVLQQIRHNWIHQKVKTRKKFPDQKGMFDSTTKKRWQSFKLFLKYQDTTENKPHPDYRTFDINLASTPSKENIFNLSMPEFKILYTEELTSHLDYVRNLYCLSCFSGLRISDVQKVSVDSVITNHDGVEIIQITTQKGRNTTAIPLFKYSREIIFNRLKAPMHLSEVKIEKHLHTIFEMLIPKMPKSFVKETKYYASNNNLECSFIGKKYRFLTFHSSRKFFATYMCTKTSFINVMSWGCWESFDSFRRYMGKPINEKETVDQINNELADL